MTHYPIQTFKAAASPAEPKSVLHPMSFRVTLEEKDRIKRHAGDQSLSAYLRDVAIKGRAKRRRAAPPDAFHVHIAKALALLGQSRLSANMNQIAKAAHVGTLFVDDDVISDLDFACQSIKAIRRDLIEALGIQSQD